MLLSRIRRSLRANGVPGTVRTALQGRVRCYPIIRTAIALGPGLEIGGPSRHFSTILPVYHDIGSLDNCVFASDTLWAKQSQEFHFGSRTGKNFFRDGSDLSGLGPYDVILSCHSLEHFANPVKALREWKRIALCLVLVLPHYRYTFDHRRPVTPVSHMLEDFERNIGEDDATHVEEILRLTDLTRAPEPVTPEESAARVHENIRLRLVHHHVFDENNSRELLETVGYDVHSSEFAYPNNIVLFAKRQNQS
jgi:hypothetical protein